MASILGLLSSETIDCGKSPSLARLASSRYEIETLGPVRRNNVSERRDAGQRVIEQQFAMLRSFRANTAPGRTGNGQLEGGNDNDRPANPNQSPAPASRSVQ
jgi:hypothetical protein